MKLSKVLAEYKQHKIGIEGVSESSAATYIFKLKKALLIMCEGDELKELSEDDLGAYLAGLRGKQSIASQRLMVTTIKGFYAWYARKYERNNPAAQIKPVREWTKHPDVLRLENVERMLIAAGMDNFLQVRNAAIVSILADTGIRVSELCELRLKDVSYEGKQFLMTVPPTKSRRSRLVPFCYMEESSMVAETFSYYYMTVKFNKGWGPDDYLFQNSECHYIKIPGGWAEGKPRNNPGGKMNRHSVCDMVKTLAARAGIERKVTPHSFRHFYATYLAVAGTEPMIIQRRLGHASLDKTMIYIHYADVVKGDSAKNNPLAKVKTPYVGAVKALRNIERVKG